MAGAAIIAGISLVAGGLILFRGKLVVMVRVLLHGRSAVQLILLHSGGMTVTTHSLHGDRNSQHIAAEERQPDGQDHCNKFWGGAEHGHSLAKLGGSVK